VEIAVLDKKMDELALKPQEIEIGIEKEYAKIEFLCLEAGAGDGEEQVYSVIPL
jgi:hypothetical protein